MKYRFVIFFIGLLQIPVAQAADSREFVELPPMMQQHMLANMRDHLDALSELIQLGSQGEWEQAAEVAEQRLGNSSLDDHQAHHMGRFMPQGMREAGSAMHRAASAFALSAQEGEDSAAWQALGQLSQTCVACHAGYRVH